MLLVYLGTPGWGVLRGVWQRACMQLHCGTAELKEGIRPLGLQSWHELWPVIFAS